MIIEISFNKKINLLAYYEDIAEKITLIGILVFQIKTFLLNVFNSNEEETGGYLFYLSNLQT